MDYTDIEKLAKLMKATGLTALEWNEEGRSLKLAMDAPAPDARPVRANPAAAEAEAAAELAPAAPLKEAEGTLFKAPMVGTLYLAPSPEAKPYVSAGDSVKKGDVLCIIEAMKLMNEITAEQDGVIEEVLAANGQLVEFGQPLFRLS